MNIITLLGLFSAIFAISLGVFVYFSTTKTKLSTVFFLFTAILGVIGFAQFHLRMSSSIVEAYFWSKLFGLWPLVSALSLHFILALDKSKKKPLVFYFLLYFPALFISYIHITTNLIVLEPIFENRGWVMQYNHNPFLTVALVFGMAYNLSAVILALYYYFKFEGNVKKQVFLIFIGYAFNILITSFSDFIFPFLNINFPDIGTIADIIPLSLLAIATWKYSLFKIEKGTLSDTLFSTISNYLILIGNNKKIIEINQSLLSLLGYSKDEVIGNSLAILIEEKGLVSNPLNSYKAQDDEFKDRIIFFKSKSGEVIEMIFSAFSIKLQSKSKFGLLYVGLNNSLDKKDNTSSEDNKKKIEFLAESALDLENLNTKEEVYNYIAKKTYNYFNKKVIVGCTELDNSNETKKWKLTALEGVNDKIKYLASILGFDIYKLTATTEGKFLSSLEDGKLLKLDFNLSNLTNGLISNKNGERAKALLGLKELYAIPIVFGQQSFGSLHIATTNSTPPINYELIESFMSITSIVIKRLYAETELAKSEKLFRSIVENSQFSIFIIDNDGKLLLAEGMRLTEIGINAKEVVGKSVFELVQKNDFLHSQILRGIKGETFKVIIDILNKYHYNVSFSPFKDEHGNQLGTLAMADDITSRIASENKLAELSEMQSKLFSVIGHDLKSPLANILSYSDLILSDFEELEKSELKHFIKNMQKAGQNGYTILNDLIDWSKSVQINTPILQEKICLRTKVLIAVQQVKPISDKKEIEIINELTQATQIFADKNMTITVLRNILSNAIKFTPKKGRIEINSYLDNQHVYLTISDNGIGISPLKLETLFNNDVKNPSRGTAGELGSGLGLQICKEFMEKNNGEILIESQIDKGSTFTLKFPIVI